MEEIKQLYKHLWGAIEKIAGKLMDGDWEHTQKASAVFGAILVALMVESLYFNKAENVRLLFVIILAAVGGGIGAAVGAAASVVFRFGAALALLLFGVALTAGPVIFLAIGVVNVLYDVIVWKN